MAGRTRIELFFIRTQKLSALLRHDANPTLIREISTARALQNSPLATSLTSEYSMTPVLIVGNFLLSYPPNRLKLNYNDLLQVGAGPTGTCVRVSYRLSAILHSLKNSPQVSLRPSRREKQRSHQEVSSLGCWG